MVLSSLHLHTAEKNPTLEITGVDQSFPVNEPTETGTSTFSQLNPTLEWPHKALNKLDLQQQALAQAPGESFW